MSIFQALEQFKGSPKLVFNEKYIGDKGAKDMAKFLESNTKIQFLELKSNDITGIGFAEIFQVLLKNPNIRHINIQHNKLGQQDEDVWVNYFSKLLNQNVKLQRLNISNNKISSKVFGQMKIPISKSKSLKLLELKYNQISSTQISSFISELQRNKNQTLLYVQLGGNKLERQVINQLEQFLKPNRQKNPIPKDNLLMTGGFAAISRNQPSFNTQATFSRNNAIDQLSKENVLRHLENLLDEAKKGTSQIKNKLQSQLVELQRQQKSDASQIIDLDRKCNELTISNRNLNYEIQRTMLEHKQIQQDQQYQNRVKEQRITEANKQLREMQTKYEQIQRKMNRQHQAKLKQTSRIWEARLKGIQDKIRGLQNETNAVQSQIQKIAQNKEKLRADYEYQQNNLRSRIQQQEIQRYDFKIKALQARISQIQANKQRFYKRGEDMLYEMQNRLQEAQKQIQDSQEKVSSLQIEEQNLVDKNKQLVSRNQQIKQSIGLKQITIQNLQKQINKLNQQIQLRKAYNREQIDKIVKDHEFERSKKGDDKQNQIQKLSEIESVLRTYKLQNAKLEQEYKTLEHRLQVTLSKAVQQVFTDSNLY